MRQPAGLLAHSFDHARVAVAHVQHRDAGEEVEVLLALGVPQASARPLHEVHGEARVGGDRVVAFELLQIINFGRGACAPAPAGTCSGRRVGTCADPVNQFLFPGLHS